MRVTLACLNILFVFWAGMASAVPAFFCVYPTPAPPLKGAGSFNDDDNDDGGKPRRRKRTKVDKYQKIWIKVRSLV